MSDKKSIIDFESVYSSLRSLQRASQAFEDVAFDLCEEDPKQALFQLLSENLTSQLIAHQNALYGSLAAYDASQLHLVKETA